MSYTVLARKYRPQAFKDLVGQEHVSRTLGNAISSSRVAHAFLFTGARGVGKTTTARLLAKALNCERGPTPEPCNQCGPCREIALGNDMDVLEIDGASNNSVDDVRRLQETLPFRPARDRFKVVIVDEVHMLSAGAFNAFLKTLEEPPEHVKFVFATTEIHKVPVTIRSRCQRYDFRLIPHAVISARLREILATENIEADDAAIALVAREAAGSMRDALTVLDQVLALGGERLEGEAVARGLGVAGRKHVWTTLRAVLEGDAAGCLRGVNDIAEQGYDVLNYTKQLLECSRDLVVFKVVNAEHELLELSPEERDVAKQLAENNSQQDLERLFSGLNALMEEVGLAGMPKLALEMGLVRLSDRPPLIPIGELLERLASLEGRLGSAAGGGGGARGPQRSSPPPSGSRGTGGPSGQRANGAVVAPPPVARPEPELRAAPIAPPPAPPVVRAPPVNENVPAPVPLPEPDAASAPRENQTAPEVAPPEAPSPPPPLEPDRAPKAAPDLLGGDWSRLVHILRTTQPALAAVLDHGTPVEVHARTLKIAFPDGSFFGRQAQSGNARDGILRAAEQIFGGRPELQIVRGEENSATTLAAAEASNRRARVEGRREAALRHPRVQEAIEVFGETESSVVIDVNME